MSNFFSITIPFCVMFPHVLHPLQRRPTRLLILRPQLINWGQGEMQIRRDRSDPWKLCDVPCSAGAAELWRQDSRWARLGWGPFKSNRIASVPVPARAMLSEQITCSSKGYDSPWHLCWDPAILDSCGLILNSYKCVLLCVCVSFVVWWCAWAPYSSCL